MNVLGQVDVPGLRSLSDPFAGIPVVPPGASRGAQVVEALTRQFLSNGW